MIGEIANEELIERNIIGVTRRMERASLLSQTFSLLITGEQMSSVERFRFDAKDLLNVRLAIDVQYAEEEIRESKTCLANILDGTALPCPGNTTTLLASAPSSTSV